MKLINTKFECNYCKGKGFYHEPTVILDGHYSEPVDCFHQYLREKMHEEMEKEKEFYKSAKEGKANLKYYIAYGFQTRALVYSKLIHEYCKFVKEKGEVKKQC